MNRFWSDVTRNLTPYIPGEQPNVDQLIKLNTNEHPMSASAQALEAIANTSAEALRRYPDPESMALRTAIGEKEALAVEQVFVGNGSDEVLAHVFAALLSSADAINTLDITYSFYPVWASLYGIACHTVPLTSSFQVDIETLCASKGPILLANPNAPTGMALNISDLEEIVKSNSNRLVVIDEAYYGFGGPTAAALINRYDNVLVTRSLSKSHALAGLRVGYALGHRELIEGLTRVKDSFNSYPLDALAQAGGAAAIRDTAWLSAACQAVVDNRAYLTRALTALNFRVCPSAANFVFAGHADVSGEAIFTHLRSQHILVRRWDKPRINDYLRITVGTREQCDALVSCLERYLSS